MTVPSVSALVFPSRLTPNQRASAERYLAAIPEAQRQALLDELEGRLRAASQGMAPVYDELRYLQRLCGQATAGAFEPNQGLKVQAERERRREALAARGARTRRGTETANGQGTAASQQVRAAQVAAMRRALGRGGRGPLSLTAG